MGLLTWLLMLPPLLLLVYDKPEDRGLHPDGVAAGAVDTAGGAQHGLALREALATPAFYILATGWFSIAMLVTTLHFYQVSILRSQDISVEVAARVFSISALTLMLAMPLVGRAFDRLPTRLVFGAGLLVTSAALVGITLVRDLPGAIAYALLFGLNNAFGLTMFGYLMPRYFESKHLGRLQGTGQLVAVVGASLGPPARRLRASPSTSVACGRADL
jgi:MFS family permease